MKRTQRISALINILSDSPNRVFPLSYFCNLFHAAKSSVSEDITIAKDVIADVGIGVITTIPGALGGVKYMPFISPEKGREFQENLCKLLEDQSRILGGGFLYTSDIMFDPSTVKEMAQIFARRFYDCEADYVVTIETKGIPLAVKTAELLNVPAVVIRREARISEGATMSINYFSGSHERVQKMSISKRAAMTGSKALIIDDFMRGGGSVKGIQDILSEFDIEVVGVGVSIANVSPKEKKISDYTPLVYLGTVDEKTKAVEVFPNSQIFLKSLSKDL